eukprot:scaffold2952_cov312-Pinguiococcus_pyrenoidosus.AAC.5
MGKTVHRVRSRMHHDPVLRCNKAGCHFPRQLAAGRKSARRTVVSLCAATVQRLGHVGRSEHVLNGAHEVLHVVASGPEEVGRDVEVGKGREAQGADVEAAVQRLDAFLRMLREEAHLVAAHPLVVAVRVEGALGVEVEHNRLRPRLAKAPQSLQRDLFPPRCHGRRLHEGRRAQPEPAALCSHRRVEHLVHGVQQPRRDDSFHLLSTDPKIVRTCRVQQGFSLERSAFPRTTRSPNLPRECGKSPRRGLRQQAQRRRHENEPRWQEALQASQPLLRLEILLARLAHRRRSLGILRLRGRRTPRATSVQVALHSAWPRAAAALADQAWRGASHSRAHGLAYALAPPWCAAQILGLGDFGPSLPQVPRELQTCTATDAKRIPRMLICITPPPSGLS